MTLVSSKVIETNRSEIVVEVKGEEWVKAVDASFKKNSKQIALPGFRKGKAPRAMIERAYGKGVFYDDAINELFPENYEAAVKEAGLKPVDQPEVEVTDVNDEGFSFKAVVTTKPEVKLGKYKGVEAVKEDSEVTEEDLAKELEDVRQRYARTSTVEGRPAKIGDLATIDFEGFDDGVAFPGGKGEKYPLALGSDSFIPGFEDQIAGHFTGEEFDINVTFPEDYQENSLAGHPVVFKIKLHEIQERILPELDDELAKDASEFDTLDEYKENLKKELSERKEKLSNQDFEGKVMDEIISNMEVEIPECMITNRIKDLVQDFAQRLAMQGLKLEDFLKYTGEDMKKFYESFRPQAENQVKSRLAMEAVAAAENFIATEEEVEAEYARLAEQYKSKVEELKLYIPSEDLAEDLGCKKALDFVVENAKAVKEKKTAAKKTTKKAVKKDDEESTEEAPKKTRARKTTAKKEEKTEE